MANTEDKTISLIKAGLDVYAEIMLRQTGMFLEDTEELAKEVKEYGRKNIRSDRELTLAVMAIRCLLENAYVVEFRVKKNGGRKMIYIIEIAAIALLLYGYTQEDRIVAWEQTKKAEAFAWINRRIAAYERRKNHA